MFTNEMKNAANKRVVGRAGQFVFGVIVPIPPHTRDFLSKVNQNKYFN